jgi:hypothetical protein
MTAEARRGFHYHAEISNNIAIYLVAERRPAEGVFKNKVSKLIFYLIIGPLYMVNYLLC